MSDPEETGSNDTAYPQFLGVSVVSCVVFLTALEFVIHRHAISKPGTSAVFCCLRVRRIFDCRVRRSAVAQTGHARAGYYDTQEITMPELLLPGLMMILGAALVPVLAYDTANMDACADGIGLSVLAH